MKTEKKFYLITSWKSEILELDVEKEYKSYIVVRGSGLRIPKVSQTQFLGETREEAKSKCIAKMKEDLKNKMKIVQTIQDRIDLIQSL